MKMYVTIGIICLVFLFICALLEGAREKKAAIAAESERKWQAFFSPWKSKIDLLVTSQAARDLEMTVQAISDNDEWKKRLLAEVKFKIEDLDRRECLEDFRKKSGITSCWPLKSMFIYELPPSPGVYRIFNIANNRCYIGESRNIRRRIETHFELLSEGKHKKKKSIEDRPQIQDDYVKFGPDAFGVQVLQTFPKDNVKQRHTSEAEYIAKFYAVEIGYNHRHNQSWNKEIINAAVKRLADGTIADSRVEGLLEATKELKLSRSQIAAIEKFKDERRERNKIQRLRKIIWTKDKILEAATQCSTRNEFKLKHPKAYDAARRHDCLNEVCAHMGAPANQNARVKKTS